MECTQRLECTQKLCNTQSDKICPEQIGFLGICGDKYPVMKGPNKIGRDPAICNIVINSVNISRQHAVINVLNKQNFMLMDLDSANQTKLSGRTLQPYIPQPLHNGDMVQFGDLFGIFRLLEEEVDLPMTQAIDIPDTPVPLKHVSRINAITTVPESPDISDKDDSFIIPSQPKDPQFRSSNTRNFIKPVKTISIQPVGSNKIDNIYWNSSKKSTSLNLDDSTASLDDPILSVKLDDDQKITSNNIHELETQMFRAPKSEEDIDSINTADTQLPKYDNPTSIHTLNTQIPKLKDNSPSRNSLNTQIPCENSPSIHSVNTQLPDTFGSLSVHSSDTQISVEKLPEVCKITKQQDMQFDLFANKPDCSIYNAETQLYPAGKENVPVNSRNNDSPSSIKSNKFSTSNDEILFDDVNEVEQPFNGFQSQAILTDDIDLPINRLVEPDFEPLSQIVMPKSAKRNMRLDSNELESEPVSQIVKPTSAKRIMRIQSDDSTDCEDDDILQTQKTHEKKVSKDVIDCEDNMIELKTGTTNTVLQTAENFEDMLTQVIVNDEVPSDVKDVDFEDMPTQVLNVDIVEKDPITEKGNKNSDLDIEDLPTQVLDDDMPLHNKPTLANKLIMHKQNSPFKVPSALKAKKKEGSKTPKIRPIPFITKILPKDEGNKYYQDTQDIYDDLCTQKPEDPVEIKSGYKASIVNEKSSNIFKPHKSVINVDPVHRGENQEAFGDEKQVALVSKVLSDGSNASDVENTPKKQPLKCMDIDLPDSQEIKTSVSLSTRAIAAETSSESEIENDSEDHCTPVVFRKIKKTKLDAKLDFVKKLDLEALPSRVQTRIRKPTAKIQDDQNKKKICNILKSKFITEQDCEIDKDIITENISRLKSKIEKTKCKESTEAEVVEVSIADNSKQMRGCRKRQKEIATVKSEEKLNKAKDSINGTKSKDVKKQEPPQTKKDLLDSKNQSSIPYESTNQSISTVDSKDKADINKSKVESHLPVEIKRSTRTRNSKAKTNEKSPSPERDNQKEKPKRKYTRKATKSEAKTEKEPSPEKEIRRSKRQRTVKEEVKMKPVKSILKKTVTMLSEESAVYNMSSNSNSDGNRSKRPSLDEIEAPSAKRTRSIANNNSTTKAISAMTSRCTQYVLFTAFPYEAVKAKLENMGAVVVTDVMLCTVLLTQQIKRTFKLLCAVGLGKPIVGPAWVQACADSNAIVDPWRYLIKDEVVEKRFQFSLERTLKGKRQFLKGYNISSTPSVMPETREMKSIVECSGGTWQEGGEQWICVSVPDDAALWPALRRRGATVVSTEFILGGVLRQRVDIQPNRLK